MATLSTRPTFLLIAAVLVPIVYFGAQAVAAPYFPNYSIYTTSASALGSDLSSRPGILNTGAFLTGALASLGSIGFAASLPRLGVSKIASYLLALFLLSAGLASFWASLHPLPDPHHNPGALGIGLFLMPFIATWVAWRLLVPRAVRAFLLLNAVAFVACGVVMSGATSVDLSAVGGLVQKLIAATAWVSTAVVAITAMWRFERQAI
ncbi:hypothetical protein [Polyangium mundeleinium]|uniref:DUF998 domain-containing protein n=1 Tax=Polyangium mundeleinium TaxID=2995306 RepID=A0ABT5F537_9BACT|nr:hypothetical protein [Polyangium mundeleinium]MDC0748627.1 hypothetical protein [Polyangium mundeleinium]